MGFKQYFLLFWLLFGYPLTSFSQGEFNNWYFGYKAGVSFNSGSPVVLTNSNMMGMTVGASVSDSLGNFWFSNAGAHVFDRNHQIMPNGSGLWGGMTPQGILPVQKLEDDSSYYLFTVGPHDIVQNYIHGLLYSIINMRLNNTLGDIEAGHKNIPVPYGNKAFSGLTATRHKNNRDVWVIVRLQDADSNLFASYRITSAGLDTIPILSVSRVHYVSTTTLSVPPMFIKITPDGNYLVSIHDVGTNFPTDTVEFCHLNNTSGEISSLFTFIPGKYSYSVSHPRSAEFSIDSRFLYLSCQNLIFPGNTIIYQYDISSHDSLQIVQSETIIGMITENSGLQMGPDLKIYGTRPVIDSLSVIVNPSIQGSGCTFIPDVISLEGRDPVVGLPQFVQRYYLYIRYTGTCWNDSIIFSNIIWPPADSMYWNFGDPASGSQNFSWATEPKHKFSSPGIYNVTLISRHIDKRFDTAHRQVEIFSIPLVSLGIDRFMCIGDSATLDAGFCTGCTYRWDNIATGQINIGNGQTLTVHDSGLYVVHVTNISGCTGRDTVQVSFSPPPLLTTSPLAKSICSGDSTYILLSSNVPAATFSWTASLTSGNVSGFSADSGLIINQILLNNTSSPGIVTYHITPNVGNCIGDTTDYAVTVNPRDTASVSIMASAAVICAGTSVTFTATPINGGTNPSYQWQVNGINVGTNNPIFTYFPDSLDLVSCILTSSLPDCIVNNPDTSNVITMTVNPLLPVSISVMASENPFCIGTSVTFTATPTAPGNLTYQWYVNGILIGSNSPILTYLPINNDAVHCSLLTDHLCVLNNPALSDTITMIGFPGLPADVTITASPNPSCQGIPVTFTATPINGGSNPSYQWQVNGINVGTNSPIYTYIPAPLDLVSCIMTSNLPCVTNNPVSSPQSAVLISPAPTVTFTPCFDTITTTNAKPIKLKGGIPLGGTYTGPGVVAGYFYPNLAGVGTHVITYTYVNSVLCSNFTSSRIHEFTNPIFNCGNVLVDIRDGKSYPTVQIGGQCWFAADLDYGVQIPETVHQRDNCLAEKYSLTTSYVPRPTYYQWDELMRYDPTPGQQGLCPPGWHVPTETEWATLFANWTNNAFAASPLKYSGYSGFNAILSGARHQTVQWDYQNFAVFFWSSTAYGPYKAWAHGMNDPDPSVSYYPALRSNAFNVRCLKD
jgi:uncharacterized protein (TIGR02145 family)